MNIRDEIDAMLDNLKTGGVKSPQPSIKAAPKKTNPPPKTVKPTKTIYDDMSVDELLNSLTVQAKAKSDYASQRLSESRADIKTASAPAAVKEPPVNIPSPVASAEKAMAPAVGQSRKKSAVESIKAAMEQSPAESEPVVIPEEYASPEENEPEVSYAEKEAFDYNEPSFDACDDIAEDVTEEKYCSETSADDDYSEETYAEEEYSEEDSDEKDYSEESEEEIAAAEPKAKKKGLFSGIKALFSKKTAPEEESAETAEESSYNDVNEEISEEFTAQTDYPVEVTDEAVFSEEVLLEQLDEELTEEVTDDIPESSDEPVQELSEEDIAEAETPLPAEEDYNAPEDTQESASDLIDAAIAAIEELNLDSENADESYTEVSDVQPESESDDAADELISDIREDAAGVIAEITGDKSDDTAEEEKSSEEEADSGSENDVDIDINVETPKKKSRVIAALENILEENPDVISDERSEKTEADSIDISLEKKSSGKLKKYLYTICGVFFAVFTVVGIIASVNFFSARFRSFTAGENKKDSFADIIYPAVIMDIESFASPSELSSEQIISASIWSLIMSEDKMSKYQQTFDIISVPAVDVEAYATELFGKNLPEISHSTVGSGELKFYYNSETKSYNVPVNPISFTYEPVITSVSKTDNKYTLVVDYIKELPAWIEDKEGYTPDVSKTAEFILTEKDGAYTISSMTLLNVNAAL